FDRSRKQTFAAQLLSHLARGFRIDQPAARRTLRVDRFIPEGRHTVNLAASALARDAHELGERRRSVGEPARAVAAQRQHPVRQCRRTERELRRAVVDLAANRIIDDEKLVDASAPAISRHIALLAACRRTELRRYGEADFREQLRLAGGGGGRRATRPATPAHPP